MRYENPNVRRVDLLSVVSKEYGLPLASLDFMPVGECSYDYRATDKEGRRYFLKIHTNAPSARLPWRWEDLEPRLRATAALRREGEIEAVVAPLPRIAGGYAVDLACGPLAVFPYAEGEWVRQDGRTEADFADLGRLLGRIHACSGERVFGDQPIFETFEIRYADVMRQLLTGDLMNHGADDSRYPVRSLLQEHRTAMLEALHYLDWLQRWARAADPALVVSHGDPTQGNLLRGRDSTIRVVDWDDVALGPAERDLIFFGGEGFEAFLKAYLEGQAAVRLHPELIEFYLYRWDLQEIADWGTRLLEANLPDDEAAHAWRELGQYLPIRAEWIGARAREMVGRSETAW